MLQSAVICRHLSTALLHTAEQHKSNYEKREETAVPSSTLSGGAGSGQMSWCKGDSDGWAE